MDISIEAISNRLLAAFLRPRFLRLLGSDQLTILMYHGLIERPMVMPDPCMIHVDQFRSQMKFLKKNFNVVSLNKSIELLKAGELTEPTVVLTFDDGYQSNYDLAFPILREEQLPATIFLTTRFTDTDTTIWPGILHNAFSFTAKTHFIWRGQHFDLRTPTSKAMSLRQIKSTLKSESQILVTENVEYIVSELSGDSPITLGAQSPYRMLNSESIKSLAASDLINLGAHTQNHYILSRLPDSMQETEIQQSVKNVSILSGEPCALFAYPNGSRRDYNNCSLAILQRTGILAALTTETGTCNGDTPLLELPRINVNSETGMAYFGLSLFNIPGRLKSFLNINTNG